MVSTGRGKNHIDNSLSECRPFCVVWNTGKNYSFCKPHHIDYSSLRSSDLYQKTLITGLKNGIHHNTRNLPGRRVSTSQADLDQTCFPFTCWKDRRKGRKSHYHEFKTNGQRFVPMRSNEQHGNQEGHDELGCDRFV